MLQVSVILIVDLLTPKSIGIISRSWPTKTQIIMSLSLIGFQLVSRQGFYALGQCDLDLWTTDPNINRDNLWALASKDLYYCVPKLKWLREKDFMLQVTVTLSIDLLTLKSIGTICRPWPMKTLIMVSLSLIHVGLKILSEHEFHSPNPCDLELWHTHSRIRRENQWVMAIRGTKKS